MTTETWIQVWKQDKRYWRRYIYDKIKKEYYLEKKPKGKKKPSGQTTRDLPWIGAMKGDGGFDGMDKSGNITAVTEEFQELQRFLTNIPTKFDTVKNKA